MKKEINPGYRIGALTILQELPRKDSNRLFSAQCDCGRLTRIYQSQFRTKRNCGCGLTCDPAPATPYQLFLQRFGVYPIDYKVVEVTPLRTRIIMGKGYYFLIVDNVAIVWKNPDDEYTVIENWNRSKEALEQAMIFMNLPLSHLYKRIANKTIKTFK